MPWRRSRSIGLLPLKLKPSTSSTMGEQIAEERKATKEALDMQWKIDLQLYSEVVISAWQAKCAEIDAAWIATKQATGEKPPYPRQGY